VDGLCEVIEDGVTGYLVPGNDEQALAGVLIQLLNNPALAKSMGENGRDRVSRLFSMERFSDSIRAIYNHFSRIA
jgi:glycosyltransferase involved in cell wall biosynthesis